MSRPAGGDEQWEDRSTFLGMPRRVIALLWLPVIVVMIVAIPNQRVSPSWMYLGLVPAGLAWVVFSMLPQLTVRRALAIVVTLAAGGELLLAGSSGWTAAAAFPMLAAFIAGMRLPTRFAVLAAAPVAVATLIVVGPYDSLGDPLVVAGVHAVMVLFGMARRDSARRVEEREQTLVADARAREEHARAEAIADRARVARDVHDVLAHSLSALAVQLQGARLMAQRDGAAPDTVAQLERAQQLASDGITEARRAVRALREGPAPVDVTAELRELVDAHPGAVLDAATDLEVGAREGETVLRTAQEALTNARKHAPGAPVTVRLHRTGDGAGVELEVLDRAITPAAPGDGQGSGLVGMAERAALVGAELEAGPTADGWRVHLRLPAPETPSATEPGGGAAEACERIGS
ncbi:sensor histidine kinase [Pseudonocardia phyllosphaerae]|uniref:sensor histidine kinase n=1 Tax=Pseudonocardia phyllosphaerae TaxID=3390502 RepID=UPI00397E4763